MNERQALLDAILETPDDDLARLVFADWLQENGEEDFAEYIRVEIEWPRMWLEEIEDWEAWEGFTPDQRVLYERRMRFINDEAWPTDHLPEWARESERKRGFIETIEAQTHQWISDGDSIVAMEPVERLILNFRYVPENGAVLQQASILVPPFHLEANRRIRFLESGCFTDEWLVELARSTSFQSLRELSLCGCNWIDGPDGFLVLAESRLCERLRVLDLSRSSFRADVVEVLAASPYLTELRELNLTSTDIGSDGAKAIAGSANFRHLEVLNFSGDGPHPDSPNIGDDGVRAIAESPHLGRLQFLDFSRNDLTDASATAIAESPVFENLRTLRMGVNRTSEAGLAKLCSCPWLVNLKWLSISFTVPDAISNDGLLAGLDGLPSLETLDLRWGSLTYTQLIGLMNSPVVGRLKGLRLGSNCSLLFPSDGVLTFVGGGHSYLELIDLSDSMLCDGGAACVARTGWQRLTSLILSKCNILEFGARWLARSPNLSTLRFLSLSNNVIGSEGAIALADSPNFPALRHLKLARCGIDDDALESMLRSPLFHSLHSLELHGNSLSDEAKARLRQEFPGADFSF